MIIGPSGQVIVDEKRQEEGLHEINGREKGQYQICFNNMFSRMTDKTVFFEVFTEEDYDDYEYDDEDYYDDYYDDGNYRKYVKNSYLFLDIPVAMKQKEKKGEWKKDLVEDEATEGMLKEKVDEMVRKLVKMKVSISYFFLVHVWLIFSDQSDPNRSISSYSPSIWIQGQKHSWSQSETS